MNFEDVLNSLVNLSQPSTQPLKSKQSDDSKKEISVKLNIDCKLKEPKNHTAKFDSSKIIDENGFLSLIQEKAKEDALNSFSYDKEWISVGDIVSLCPRKIYYRFKNAEFDLDKVTKFPYTFFITSVGSHLHQLIQDMFSKVYPHVEIEIRIEDEKRKIKGFVDLLYETSLKTKVLVEIKTIAIDELWSSGFKGRISHWKQAAMYWYLLRENFNITPMYVQLLYIARELKPVWRDNKKLQPFRIFTADPVKLWNRFGEELLNNYKIIKEALETGKIPEVHKFPNWKQIQEEECVFCPYQDICHKSLQEQSANQVSQWAENLFFDVDQLLF